MPTVSEPSQGTETRNLLLRPQQELSRNDTEPWLTFKFPLGSAETCFLIYLWVKLVNKLLSPAKYLNIPFYFLKAARDLKEPSSLMNYIFQSYDLWYWNIYSFKSGISPKSFIHFTKMNSHCFSHILLFPSTWQNKLMLLVWSDPLTESLITTELKIIKII